MNKIALIMMMALSLYATNPKYDVNFRGITLGEIKDISTVKELYLKAEVTSRIARFMLGKDFLVYYGGEKPDVEKAKYKKDKKMMIYAFYQSLNERPKMKTYKINDIKKITLSCEGNVCKFEYIKKEKVNGKGEITFDKENQFVSLTEEMSKFAIVRQ